MTLTRLQVVHCPQVIAVAAWESTAIQLLKTVQHMAEHSVGLLPPQLQRQQQLQLTRDLPQQIQAGLCTF